MRRLSYCLFVLLLALSCSKDENVWNGPVIEFSLYSDDSFQTKSGSDGTATGVDSYNENLISYVDFFFYPDGNTDADATFHVRRSIGRLRSAVVRLELSSEDVNRRIFPLTDNVKSAEVVAVANWPEELVPENGDLSGTSLPQLMSHEITTHFEASSTHRQTSFPMSGRATISLRGRTQVVAAAATIPLLRYACKLTVGVNVAQEVKVGDEVWTPMLSGMEVYLVNGVNNVTLGGEAAEPSYFSYRDNALRFAYENGGQTLFYFDKSGDFYATFPTYMYPQHWEYGNTRSPKTEPYLKLVLPWARQADEDKGILYTQRQCYYKIVIPDDRRQEYRCAFVRNNWYHINVTVGILGSETDEALVSLNNGWCFVYDWQDKDVVIKNAEIGSARYLSVEQERYDLYNVSDKVDLPFVSSHPVVLRDIRVTRPYYGTKGAGSTILGGKVKVAGDNDIYEKGRKYLDYSESEHVGEWLRISEAGTSVEFHHPLNNDYTTAEFDSSPYTFTYSLVHEDRPDDETYHKTQTVVQSPAIYIETTINTDVKENGYYKHWGYVYVNNEQYLLAQADADLEAAKEAGGSSFDEAAWKKEAAWRVVHYSEGGRDMVKINVTVLPGDSEFIIGDPRTDYVDNLGYDGWNTDRYGRTLQYYYPTDASDRTRDMIAPIFRISTKHSGTEYGGTTLENARKRCASLQENGFPAGRWRLPTRAEIRFSSLLSGHGHFEWQFGGDYWSAQGAINVNRNTGVVEDNPSPKNGLALIRCVYDSWFWGNDQLDDLTAFTWADALK
jgi:hypothetical protein